jgi:hypothetical protein
MSSSVREKEWASLYAMLSKSLGLLGTENAFGEADFWIVDDDYGGTTHKLCIHKLSFLRPELITAIQIALKSFSAWQVMVQLEIETDGLSLPPEGIVIYSDHVEQHWDRIKFVSLTKALNL